MPVFILGTDALPCHIYLPVCLWIMDPRSTAPKRNTSHGNEVLPHDATHLTQRPFNQRGSPRQDPAGDSTTRRPPDHRKETQTAVVMVTSPVHHVQQKPSCKAQRNGEEDKADRRRGGKTTLGNGQAWSLPSPRGQWRTGKKRRKLVVKSSVVPKRPSWLRDRWWWWWWWWW